MLNLIDEHVVLGNAVQKRWPKSGQGAKLNTVSNWRGLGCGRTACFYHQPTTNHTPCFPLFIDLINIRLDDGFTHHPQDLQQQ